jgi:hypothetical protein
MKIVRYVLMPGLGRFGKEYKGKIKLLREPIGKRITWFDAPNKRFRNARRVFGDFYLVYGSRELPFWMRPYSLGEIARDRKPILPESERITRSTWSMRKLASFEPNLDFVPAKDDPEEAMNQNSCYPIPRPATKKLSQLTA